MALADAKTKTKKMTGPDVWALLSLLLHNRRDSAFWNLEYPLQLIKSYDDMVYFEAFKYIVVSDPVAFEHILKTNAKNYIRNPYFYETKMQPIFNKSLLSLENEPWRERRKLTSPLYNHAMLKHYATTITRITQDKINAWQKTPPTHVNILTEMGLLSLEIAFELFTGFRLSAGLLQELSVSIHFCMKYVTQTRFIHPLKPTPDSIRFFSHMKKIDSALFELIQKRKMLQKTNAALTPNLLDRLLETLPEKDIVAELKSHVIPGHETTGCCLSWMWYLLAQNPDIRSAMLTEIDSALQGECPSPETVSASALPLTKAIISETLRLYPPIWCSPRTNLNADIIKHYKIPKKSTLSLNLYALHRNPRYWDNPHAFKPERFLDTETKRHPFSFLPFLAGNHTCIGSHLGMLEATLMATQFAQHFIFELAEPSVEARPEPCISLRPKHGITMLPIPRTKSTSPLT